MVDHIAFILDGNRRYAKKHSLKPWDGHNAGFEKLKDVAKWCKELGITQMTLYIFSTENFKRSEEEKKHLFSIFRKSFTTIKAENKDVKIRFIGRRNLFPKDMIKIIENIEKDTADNKPYAVNFAMGYGGRAEIIDAVKKISTDIKDDKLEVADIDESLFKRYLYLSSEPDIVVRTGGAVRTSNFLIWQSCYSEWFFLDKFWPEITSDDLKEIVAQFRQRKRNFGK